MNFEAMRDAMGELAEAKKAAGFGAAPLQPEPQPVALSDLGI